jgi:hypothetical protein
VADVVLQVRDAEVDEHGLAVLEQHVARLDVTVDDPAGVDRSNRLGHAAREAEQVLRRKGTALLDDLVEGWPGHPARDDERSRARDVRVDDGRHPLAGDARERLHLADQACARVLVVGDVGTQGLDRNGPAAAVDGEVHDAHPALADLLDEAVLTEALGLRGHAGRRDGLPLCPVVRTHAPTVFDRATLTDQEAPTRGRARTQPGSTRRQCVM